MQFKDIKQNQTIFILDKQEFTVVQGKATSVGFSRVGTNPSTGKTEMLIDITVEYDGKTGNYAVPEHLSIAYTGNLIMTPNQADIVAEIKSAQHASDQYFAAEPHHRKVRDKAPGLLADMDPTYKEKQQTEQRFKTIETTVQDMKAMLSDFINEFKK